MLNELVDLSFGFRADASSYSADMNNLLDQVQPRFSVKLQIPSEWSLNANTGIYYQLPAYTTLGFRDEAGELVNKDNGLSYVRGKHLVAGVEFQPEPATRFSVKDSTNYMTATLSLWQTPYHWQPGCRFWRDRR